MRRTVTKIDESWTRPPDDILDQSPSEAREYLLGQRGPSTEGKTHFSRAKVWVEKYQQYLDTHQYTTDNGFFRIKSTPFYCALKFKSSGEMVKWPEYNADPPGLYEVKTKRGSYVYEVKTQYYITLHAIGISPYKSPATYIQAYGKHNK